MIGVQGHPSKSGEGPPDRAGGGHDALSFARCGRRSPRREPGQRPYVDVRRRPEGLLDDRRQFELPLMRRAQQPGRGTRRARGPSLSRSYRCLARRSARTPVARHAPARSPVARGPPRRRSFLSGSRRAFSRNVASGGQALLSVRVAPAPAAAPVPGPCGARSVSGLRGARTATTTPVTSRTAAGVAKAREVASTKDWRAASASAWPRGPRRSSCSLPRGRR